MFLKEQLNTQASENETIIGDQDIFVNRTI